MRPDGPIGGLGRLCLLASAMFNNLVGYALSMGLTKQYLRVGQSAKNRLFGVPPVRRGPSLKGDRTPLSSVLISEQGSISQGRLAVVILGIGALALGILMSTLPWVDWVILKQLRLWNGTLSYYYWKQPGVMRLTKVFVFNMTNPEAFLSQGQKPKLEEIGPFVFREDMEKANIKFHENGTVSFQHKKILRFVPELSAHKDSKLVVPNIPLLTLTSKSADLPSVMRIGLSMVLKTLYRMKEFNTITANELLFGYEESLTNLAHKFYPRGKRPPAKMGLLIGRNTSLMGDVQTIYTGHTSMADFGLMEKLNGLDHLPYWTEAPCNTVRSSEGSFFPPREVTQEDVVNLWDKDLCRVWPMRYRFDLKKNNIKVGMYTPDDNIFTNGDKFKDNKCFCPGREKCPPDGLQDISPCQFGAPVFLSYPHFYGINNPDITDKVEGLKPDESKHASYVLIQQRLGVPLEARIRVQLNLKVTHSNLGPSKRFPSMYFPVIWVEEGVAELPYYLLRWIYLATELSTWLVPLGAYCLMVFGAFLISLIFLRAYRTTSAVRRTVERGKRTLRRGSSFFINGQHRLLIIRDSYTLLQNQPVTAETSFDPEPEA